MCVNDPGYWLEPEVRQSLKSKMEYVNKPGGETVYIPSGLTQLEVRKILRDLENRAWMDPQTARVEMVYTTYNAHMDIFTAIFVVMFLNRAGHIHRMVQPVSFWLTPYPDWTYYVADVIWLSMVLKIFYDEVKELFRHLRRRGCSKGIKSYVSFENVVDWVNVFYGAALIAMWFLHLNKVQELKRDYLEQASVNVVGSWKDENMRVGFFNKVDDIIQGGESRRIWIALYPFVVLSRFFKAFSAQPRLSLVTQTVKRAAVDLIHFGLVFMSIFMLFTLSAIVLFGQDIKEFANFARAADNSFHILLGEFDWEMMKQVGRVPAGIWFWSFMWLVNLVMLNMLLAIVMDVYTEVKSGIGSNAETLWSQAYEMYRRWRELRRGKRVSLNHILAYIAPEISDAPRGLSKFFESDGDAEDGPKLTVKAFLAKVPNLEERQAKRVLVASEELAEHEAQKSQSLSEAMLDIQRIDKRLTHLADSMQRLIQMSEMGSQLLTRHLGGQQKQQVDREDSPKQPWLVEPPEHKQQVHVGLIEPERPEVARPPVQPEKESVPEWFEAYQRQHMARFDSLEAVVKQVGAEVAQARQARQVLREPSLRPSAPSNVNGSCSLLSSKSP
jgi:hypothetical protein